MSVFVLLMGCSDDDENKPIDDVEQTHWKGTFQDPDKLCDMIIVFRNVESGYFILDDNKEEDSFRYNLHGKTIYFSCLHTGLLDGTWWIYKMTENDIILKQYPYEEDITSTLNLKRIY